MTNSVMVETNWIVDVALQRDSDSGWMWRAAKERRLSVILPAVCLAEAVKALETLQRQWRSLGEQMKRSSGELQRYRALDPSTADFNRVLLALARLEDAAEARVWPVLQEMAERARLLHVSSAALARAADLKNFLNLAPADAAVLGSILVAKDEDICDQFMSRDKRAFREAGTAKYMRDQGLFYYDSASDFVRLALGGGREQARAPS